MTAALTLLSALVVAVSADSAKQPKPKKKPADQYLFKAKDTGNVYRYDQKGRPIIPPVEKKPKETKEGEETAAQETASTTTTNVGSFPPRQQPVMQGSPAMGAPAEDDGI